MSQRIEIDVLVIGSGPAGQKAAVQAAKAGKTVALVERDQSLGGACVHRGTIPSKTLRENALRVKNMRKNASLCNFELAEDTEMSTLIDRLNRVLKAHDGFMVNQIERNNIIRVHGRAKFVSPNEIEVTKVRGEPERYYAKSIVIASGSIPRQPDNIPVDHESKPFSNLLDIS